MSEPQELPQFIFGEGIIRRFADLQAQRLVQERRMMDQMKAWDHGMPKPTRWQRFARWASSRIRRTRVALARWIAGDEWPENY